MVIQLQNVKRTHSIMRQFLFIILFTLFSLPATAQQATDAGEIIYRVNLGNARDVAMLLEEGASADQKDYKGTPLVALAAARPDNGGLKILRTLFEAGADINAKDRLNRNALFHAAAKGNDKIVEFLLENKINYYAVDANGDIARTIAYREGHNDIVQQLDDFVRAENEKVADQYRELSKALEDQYNAQETKKRVEAEEAAKEALELSRKLTDDQERAKEIQTAQAEELARKRASDEALQMQYDLAFHACAFQYWSFCRDARQTSELEPAALQHAIDSHLIQIGSLSKNIRETYKTGKKFTDKIIKSAQHSVFNELNNMPSRTYRFELGVCQMEDLVKRCNEVSKYPGHITVKKAAKQKKKGGSSRRGTKRIRGKR